MKKYGMRYDTIRYWQNQARELWRYNGIVRGISTFDNRNLAIAHARDIGHAAISLAAVLGTERVRAELTDQPINSRVHVWSGSACSCYACKR